MPDIVRPYITGFLARPENVRDLRDGIAKLLGDSGLRSSEVKWQQIVVGLPRRSMVLSCRRADISIFTNPSSVIQSKELVLSSPNGDLRAMQVIA